MEHGRFGRHKRPPKIFKTVYKIARRPVNLVHSVVVPFRAHSGEVTQGFRHISKKECFYQNRDFSLDYKNGGDWVLCTVDLFTTSVLSTSICLRPAQLGSTE